MYGKKLILLIALGFFIAGLVATNGVNSLMRSPGTTSSSAVLGVLLASFTRDVGGVSAPTLNAYLIGLTTAALFALIASGLAAAIPAAHLCGR